MASRRAVAGLGLAVLLLLSACGAPPAGTGRLRVVATFSILGDLVRNVAGDQIDLTVLVGPESDTHSYEPAPADTRALADAQLIFENGLGLEPWLNALTAAAGARAPRVVVSNGLTLLNLPGEPDPHVWQAVPNAAAMTRAIAGALAQADPAQAATYQANADKYLNDLAALDADLRAQAAALPAARRKLVTNHDTFGYFAQAYGFVIVGDALGTVSTEGSEPSAAQLAALADKIRAEQVPALFAENIGNPELIQRLAQEAGVRVGPALYTDALGAPGSAGDTYLKLMRANMTAIVGALR